MKIGIDARGITGGTGIPQYTKSLIQEYIDRKGDDEYILFCDAKKDVEDFVGEQKNVKIVVVKRGKIPLLGTHWNITRACTQEKIDILHSPTGSAPLFWRGRSVITIHDLAIYDHPEWFPGGQWFSMRVVVPRSIRRAEKIIAVSEYTKKKIIARFDVREEKIEVQHETVKVPVSSRSDTEVLEHFHLPKNFVLCLGTIEPRKNIGRLIDAFMMARAEFPEEKKDTILVLAGKMGRKSGGVESLIKKHARYVRHIGFVTEKEKWSLLRTCQFLAFISLEEGFGLPLAEARAVGTPVLAADIPVFHEVGGEYPVFVDPENINDINKRIIHLL